MSDDVWIVVPNWDRFQHYTDRTPPWIKLYLELLHNDDWLDLNDTARGLLARIWVQFAASRGVLKLSSVRDLGWSKHHSSHIEALNHAGFIHLVASTPLAQRREDKKREHAREPKKPKPRPLDDAHKANAAAYRPFPHPEPQTFDPAGIELLKEWLKR